MFYFFSKCIQHSILLLKAHGLSKIVSFFTGCLFLRSDVCLVVILLYFPQLWDEVIYKHWKLVGSFISSEIWSQAMQFSLYNN